MIDCHPPGSLLILLIEILHRSRHSRPLFLSEPSLTIFLRLPVERVDDSLNPLPADLCPTMASPQLHIHSSQDFSLLHARLVPNLDPVTNAWIELHLDLVPKSECWLTDVLMYPKAV